MKNAILFCITLFAMIALYAFKPGDPETHTYYCSYFYDGMNLSAATIQVDGPVSEGKHIVLLESRIKAKRPEIEEIVIINIQHLPID